MAEVLFVLLVHKTGYDTDIHSSHTPIRLAVCNLWECQAVTTHAGGACWDVDISSNPKHSAYPVEFPLLREKLVRLSIPEAPHMVRLGRVHHQSMLHRGRNWRRSPQY